MRLSDGTILVVDDSSDMILMFGAYFKRTDLKVAFAGSGTEALKWMYDNGMPVALVSDFYLPDMTGLELIGWAQGLFPNLKAMLATGKDVTASEVGIPVMQKPIRFPELLGTLKSLVEGEQTHR